MEQPARWWTRGATAALGLLAVALAWDFVHDDGFITLRYAWRFLHGRGLTWTDGPPVEGFTHPLWFAQLVVLGALGVDLPLAARLLGVAWLGVLVLAWSRTRSHPGPLLVLLALPAVGRWAVSGLETLGFTALVVLASILIEREVVEREIRPPSAGSPGRRGAVLGLVLAGATLTRPEGLGVALAAVVILALQRRARLVAALVGVLGLVLGGALAARLALYGAWISTSSAAKLGDFGFLFNLGTFLAYTARSAETLCFALVPVALALGYGRARALLVPTALAAPLVAAMVVAGGDHMPHARFWVPVVALELLGSGWALADGLEASRRRLVGAGCGVLVALLLALGLADPARADEAALYGLAVGRVLAERLPAGALVAVATAGSTPYAAPTLNFTDTLGLNDPFVASRPVEKVRAHWQILPGHRKGSGDHVLSLEPAVIVLGPAFGSLGTFDTEWFLADRELLESPAFHARYEPVGVLVQLAPGERLFPEYDPDALWSRQTGLDASTRPAALAGAGPLRAFPLIAWLRRGDPRVARLREGAVPLTGLRERARATRALPPFCQELAGPLLGSVPCDDGTSP